MKKINVNELNFDESAEIKSGSFGDVQKCTYGNKTYALKTFHRKGYYDTRMQKKLDALQDVNVNGLITPKYTVYNEKPIGYLTLYSDAPKFLSIKKLDTKDKVKALMKVRKLIEKMHDAGIIHTDLHPGNIKYNGNPFIIDFDNSVYKKFKCISKHGNDYMMEYAEKYGIDKDLDIAMFNFLTFYILNDVSYYPLVSNEIRFGKYGVFEDKDAIEICKSLTLDKKPIPFYLIDLI